MIKKNNKNKNNNIINIDKNINKTVNIAKPISSVNSNITQNLSKDKKLLQKKTKDNGKLEIDDNIIDDNIVIEINNSNICDDDNDKKK